jgi:hypothetical protein
MQLLLRQRAAAEWGWVAGMSFCHSEVEDYLLELLQYIWRRRAWDVTPLFREKHEGDDLEWFFEREDRWDFQTADDINPRDDEPRVLLERQRLKMLCVPLANKLEILVFHMLCRNTLQAFYYMNVGCWVARCGSVQECVALLNAIAEHKDRILFREQDPIRHAHLRRKINELRDDAKTLETFAL